MRIIGIDTETHLITPGRQAPRLVCMSYDDGAHERGIDLAPEGIRRFLAWISRRDTVLVAHNMAFDATVLIEAAVQYFGPEYGLYAAQLVFQAYAQGRLVCTVLRETLADLARGAMGVTHGKAALPSQAQLPHRKKAGIYSLAGCMWRHFRIDRGEDKAEDAVRYRYHEVEGLPVAEWGADFQRYALQDSTDVFNLYQSQQRKHRHTGCFDVQTERCKAAFTLRLAEIWGIRTDGPEVVKLHTHCRKVVDAIDTRLLAAGLMRERYVKGAVVYSVLQKRVREWVASAYTSAGEEPPRTNPSKTHEHGQVKTDTETLEGIATLYEGLAHSYRPLVDMAKAGLARGLLAKYIPTLLRGTILPIHARYNPLLTTGRTSASDYAQTPPRDCLDCYACGLTASAVPAGAEVCPQCGEYIGDVRRCYKAREGYVYGFVDYDQLELCTLGQSCVDLLGHSTIADAINAGLDLHSLLGAELMGGATYQEFDARKKTDRTIADWRARAKGANFGLPGKLGVGGLQRYLRAFGAYVTMRQARHIKETWSQQWPDMNEFFRAVYSMGFAGFGSTATIRHPRTGLIRGECELPSACNFMFQGLAASGALDAGFHLAQEMYCAPKSPLFGSRICLFLHDEWGMEHPETKAPEAADRASAIMRGVMQHWTPDVEIRGAEPALMQRWYKGAQMVRDASGRLQVWRPA